MKQLLLCAVVTQPPRPIGRKQKIAPTPVESWANAQSIAVLSFPHLVQKPWLFENERTVVDSLQPFKADILISASYGQKIPWETVASARFGGLNVHPSLLPRWRGADPVPWAILAGDRQTGVTIVTLSKDFDRGSIIAQKKVPITDSDTSDQLRTKLFTLGVDLLIEHLPQVLTSHRTHLPPTTDNRQPTTSYARRLTRDDGFLPWELIQAAMDGAAASTLLQCINLPALPASKLAGNASVAIVRDYMRIQKHWKDEKSLGTILERFHRALSPWPGIWTKLRVKSQKSGVRSEERRLKILSVHLGLAHYTLNPKFIIDLVQLEGKTPTEWPLFSKAYRF